MLTTHAARLDCFHCKKGIFMSEFQRFERLLLILRRLHATATRLDPDDPELATMHDDIDEVAQAVEELKRLEHEQDETDDDR